MVVCWTAVVAPPTTWPTGVPPATGWTALLTAVVVCWTALLTAPAVCWPVLFTEFAAWFTVSWTCWTGAAVAEGTAVATAVATGLAGLDALPAAAGCAAAGVELGAAAAVRVAALCTRCAERGF